MNKRVIWVGVIALMMLIISPIVVVADEECDGSVADCLESESNNSPNSNDETDEPIADQPTEDNSENEEAIGSSNQSLFLDFLRMIAALVLVLALIYIVLKFIQKRTRNYQQTRALENIGGVSLGHNKSAQIVRVGDEFYLIGVGDDVNYLTKIEDQDTIDQLMTTPEEASSNMSFQSIFQSFQNKRKNSYQEAETKNQFKTELETMKNSRQRMRKRYQDKEDDSNE
ncbi:flagellar biosynthetic protein FliO [Alkalibacillus almallahensis]|uniref:flagellar biosynthetic protein FliO n=1 Tax=Alkalibacillus almallahensis TaxID=1379154 RepID=UPI0014248645|nr:flagellar biosynthetic protein FliO [Alkalibacillus almallahensis]NIK10799.1 flagellar protein FliO/FliZ [Alkalibacillus almallahensis]